MLGLGALTLVCAGLAGLLWIGLAVPAGARTAKPVTVVVAPGTGLRQIAATLRRAGVVRWAWAFEVLAVAEGDARRLQAGTYVLDPSLPPQAALGKLAAGAVTIPTTTVVVPEGWTVAQIVTGLAAQGLGGGRGALTAAAGDAALLAGAALPAPAAETRVALEGYLYPATYRFGSGLGADQIFSRMLQAFTAAWTPSLAAAARINAGLNTAQAVTLASIVQREVADPAQMPLVAGIYLHRLRVGMRLDADPTVLYALGLLGQAHSLSLAQTATPSAYNTYQVVGLPPGPICSPGAAALAAVAHPAATTALYFLTDPQGAVVTADSLQQQIANQQKYYGP